MELANEMYRFSETHSVIEDKLAKELVRNLLILLAPFVPHITEELWQQIGEKENSVHDAEWPVCELAVQVNGKVRGTIKVAVSMEKDEIADLAKGLAEVQKFIEGKTIVKTIVVPGRIVNIVVK